MYAILDIFLSFLPARYRRRYDRNPVSGTFRSAILQGGVALVAYGVLFFRYVNFAGPASGDTLASGPQGNLYWLSFGLGAINWLAFCISPGPLLAMYCMIEATVRGIASGVANEPMASLPFWLIGCVHDGIDRLLARRRMEAPAPDLVETGTPGCGWEFRVTSMREKEGWHALVQIQYLGEFYRIQSSGQELVDGKIRFRYYLRKAAATEAYRGIIPYDPFEYWKTDGK